MDSNNYSPMALTVKAARACELKDRIKQLQAGRSSNRDACRDSDAKWRAKLTQSFQTVRDIWCPRVREQACGKNMRRIILEEAHKEFLVLEQQVIGMYGHDALAHFRSEFETFEAKYNEPVLALPPPPPLKKSKMKVKFSPIGLNNFPAICYEPSATVVKAEESVQTAEDVEPFEPTFVDHGHAIYGCSQTELNSLEELLEKTPTKDDLMEVTSGSAPQKWSVIKGRIKCSRKLDMDPVAEEYLETSDELKKDPVEAENYAKLSQLSGQDVLEYFENSNNGASQSSQKTIEVSSSPRNSNPFEFDDTLVAEFLTGEGSDYVVPHE